MGAVIFTKMSWTNEKSFLRSLLKLLLVDVIPMVLFLLLMAYGMLLVSAQLDEPKHVEIPVVNEKLS